MQQAGERRDLHRPASASRGSSVTCSGLVLALLLTALPASAAESYPDVPAVPADADWSFAHKTASGLETYIAKPSLRVLRDRSGFAVWLKLARSEPSVMAPMAAYVLHDCDNPRRMRLGQAVNLRSQARSGDGRSAWLPDVPISSTLKATFCPKIARLKAQEERDRTADARGGQRILQATAGERLER